MNTQEVLDEFSKGFDCASVVLAHFSEELNMDREVLLRLGAPFSGGLGENSVCGALNGALMVIGLKYGNSIEDDEIAKVNVMKKRHYLLTEFKNKMNSINCSGVLGKDLTKKDDLEYIVSNNLFATRCPEAVLCAIDIVEGLMKEDE